MSPVPVLNHFTATQCALFNVANSSIAAAITYLVDTHQCEKIRNYAGLLIAYGDSVIHV